MDTNHKVRKHNYELILAMAMNRTVEKVVNAKLDAKENEIIERVLQRLTQRQSNPSVLPGCIVNQGGGI